MENLWKIGKPIADLWKTNGKIGKPMEIRMELEWKINGTSTIFVDFLFGKDWFPHVCSPSTLGYQLACH